MSVEKKNVTHWIIRVGDGTNIRNGKYSVWGFKMDYLSLNLRI